jgi:2-polyprenyl-3-methyl-5-hydroxy-6-metoxy-1,4-benzoquinol methylase/glycosyltransferase involved in cell wall biosynthesis
MTRFGALIDIIVYSNTTDETIAQHLGRPEYSYYFVAKKFIPLLQTLGNVRRLERLDLLAAECWDSRAAGRIPILFCFTPPHYLPLDPPCEVIPVFAWEYDTIPNETWTGDPRQNWVAMLQGTRGAITHSEHISRVVKKAIGPSYHILSIPAPVWDVFQTVPRAVLDGSIFSFTFEGTLLDSSRAEIDAFGNMLLQPRQGHHRLELSGTIYSSILNPTDGRKNLQHLVTGFVDAFRDEPNSTLVLKLIVVDAEDPAAPIIRLLRRLQPFLCRVIAITAFLEESTYKDLIQATTWIVNASVGEGQCLPLMEFLSAGRPAIAPNHTAMADYIDDENAMIVASSKEWCSWPPDPRGMLRCFQHRIDWSSLRNQYKRANEIVINEKDRYRKMSESAREAARRHNSKDVLMSRLDDLLSYIVPLAVERETSSSTGEPVRSRLSSDQNSESDAISAPTWKGGNEATSRHVGLVDSQLSGWFRVETNELFEGFSISPSDIVIDVGCGEGHHLSFCAARGAHLVGVDVDRDALISAKTVLSNSNARKVELYEGAAEGLPLPSSYGTRIICSEVLEHVEDYKAALAELNRIGQPGALYLLTVPDTASEELQRQVAPESYFRKPNHIRIFERDALQTLASQAGLEVLSHTAYGFYWSVWWGLFWACDVDLKQPEHPTLDHWNRSWQALLASPAGPRIKTGLDKFLPKSRVILARKPRT